MSVARALDWGINIRESGIRARSADWGWTRATVWMWVGGEGNGSERARVRVLGHAGRDKWLR